MSNTILAGMQVVLGVQQQGLTTGLKKAEQSLLNFQGSADKLKGVDLGNLRVNVERMVTPIGKLQAESRKLGTALRQATDEKTVKALNAELERTTAEMMRLRSLGRSGLDGIATGGSSAAGGMNKLAGSAGQVNMEFARIIQDAPFGMMGIGNNIQQLTANFGQLQRQAGGTKAALGAAFASLLTPASLLTLGIAALTTGWVLYEKWQQKAAKAAKDGGDALTNAKKATDEYIQSLSSVNQARINGEREAQKEITSLRVLYNQTQNTTLSLKARKEAADEILKQYPESFKGLTQEEILLGKAVNAYNGLTTSLLANARARAGLDLITDKSRQQLVNEQKIADLRAGLLKQQAKLDKVSTISGSAVSRASESGAIRQAIQVSQAQNAIKDTQAEINALVAQNNKLKADSLRLEKEISGTVLTTGGTEAGEGKSTKTDTKQTDYLKELQVAFDQSTKEAILFGNTYDEMSAKAGLFKQAMIGLMSQGLMPQNVLIQGLKSSYDLFSGQTIPIAEGALKRFAETDLSALKESIDGVALSFSAIPAAIAPMSESMKAFLAEQAAMAEAAMAQIEISAEQMTSFMQGSIANALVGLGEAFGQLAISGDVSGFFDSIIGMVADFAGNFGKMLIGAGVAALAFESLLANPAGAIAAGVALVAAASAVKSVLAKGPSGGGGVAPSISGIGGGYNQPRMGTSYEGEKEMRFRIEGQDLVAIVNRQNYKTGRIG